VSGRLQDRILVGRFGAPHGVRGEIRLQSFTQDPLAIGTYGPLAGSDGRVFTLKSVRLIKDNMLVARVDGIADRTAAEALTHIELSLARAALPPPEEEEFYVADLVGLEATTEAGETLGTILGVPNYGGGDLLEVRPARGGESLLFPFTKAVVPTIDIPGRRVVVAPPDEVEADDEPQ
jgi:16S rRNA processing protein RimM